MAKTKRIRTQGRRIKQKVTIDTVLENWLAKIVAKKIKGKNMVRSSWACKGRRGSLNPVEDKHGAASVS